MIVTLARVRIRLRTEDGRAARRNDDPRRCFGLAHFDGAVNRLAVVSPIGHDTGDLAFDLLQQVAPIPEDAPCSFSEPMGYAILAYTVSRWAVRLGNAGSDSEENPNEAD